MAKHRRGGPSSSPTNHSITRTGTRLLLAAVLASALHPASSQEIFNPNFGAIEQPTGDGSYRPRAEVSGQGVVLATGNKIEVEDDFSTLGELPLFLRRTYNHHWSATGLFGKHWLSNFDYSLATSVVSGQVVLWLQRPDGRRIKFVPSGAAGRWNEDKASSVAYVIKNADGTYTHKSEGHDVERYGADGFILQRTNEQGVSWLFAYSGKYLQRVTHTSGRYVQFVWNGTQLVQAIDPGGNAYNYSYTANAFGTGRGRLATATLPGVPATTITYHYEDTRFPGGLTGKSYNGVRHSTYSFDADGRTASTELAGGVQRYVFEYAGGGPTSVSPPPLPPAPGGIIDEGGGAGGWCEYQSGSRICFQPRFAAIGGGPTGFLAMSALASTGATVAVTATTPFTVTETNPLGKRTVYQFIGDRLASVSRTQSTSTAAAYREREYDANGYENLVSNFTDGLSDYDYDAHGHLVKRVDALGKPFARTTLTTWDEAKNRVSTVTISGVSETAYSYAADGRIERVDVKNLKDVGLQNSIQSTRFVYTKHANGLLATVAIDGPLSGTGDTLTINFNALGDKVSERNEPGHTTVYSNHNAMGQAGTVVGPNGERTDYQYDARGRVTVAKVFVGGVSQATSYVYDGHGRLVSIQLPNGSTRWRIYDNAGRIVEEYERENAGTYARRVSSYNALSERIQVEVHRTAFPYNTQIAGNIDGVASNTGGGFDALGWACTTGQNAPINVHMYIGGGAGSGVYAGSYVANQASEPTVATACQAQGQAYRFKIALTDAMRDQHGGKAIYVHGISPAGKTNSLVGGSGAHLVPRLLPNVAPTGLTAPPKSILSSWTVSWNAASRSTRYRLEESANGGAWTLIHDAAATNKAISGKGGGKYSYRVRGCNEVGCGPVSESVTVDRIVAPTTAPVPSAPGVNDTGSYSVNVTSVAGATYYVIDESPNAGSSWYQVHNGASTSVALTNRSTTTDYQYRSRACNDAGCGPTSSVVVVQRPIYGAQFVSQAAFGLSLPGQSHTVTIQMRNTGNTTWTTDKGYRLGSQNPGDNITWGLHRVAIPGSVSPGATATFTFNVTAPSSPGLYNFQWRMVRDGYAWFGDYSPNSVKDIATAAISANPNPCKLYIGQAVCSSRISWSASRGDAEIWVTNVDNSGPQLFYSGNPNAAATATWIPTNGKRFHVKSAGVTLAYVDVYAYQSNESYPEPDPPPCPTNKCHEP